MLISLLLKKLFKVTQRAQFPIRICVFSLDFSEKFMNVLLFASKLYLMGKKHAEPQYWCHKWFLCVQ